jgi:ubiquinone/menaquinone biosynthesis C-methylase UbiE
VPPPPARPPRPGGTICFHEYSVRDSPWTQPPVWNAVALGIIIPAGLVTSPRSDIYRYLRASVNDFDGVAAFEARLARAGFTDIKHRHTMDGWQAGIVHSFLARRPADLNLPTMPTPR